MNILYTTEQVQQRKHTAGEMTMYSSVEPREGVETPAFIGFTIPDVWLIGMGMDDADTAPEARRWTGYIAEV